LSHFCFHLVLSHHPRSPLFPYTTLFRSLTKVIKMRIMAFDYGTKRIGIAVTDPLQIIATALTTISPNESLTFIKKYIQTEAVERSEEHTSELQSRENLVCRLLLEKKK